MGPILPYVVVGGSRRRHLIFVVSQAPLAFLELGSKPMSHNDDMLVTIILVLHPKKVDTFNVTN